MAISSTLTPLTGLALRCQPDSRLVMLSREGQDRAFEEIVRRYRTVLVSFAGAIVPAHRAEDVVQEALAKAHAALAASGAEIQLKPWLYTIVRNRALNDLRDEPLHEHLDESFDGVPQPPQVAARRAELAALVQGLKGLPAAQREALVKRELEGRGHEEIAAALGTTPGAVRGLIFRARTALRDGMGMLVPAPVLRLLLGDPLGGTAVGAGGAVVGIAGGGSVALKAGAALVVTVLAVGSGIALHDGGGNGSPAVARADALGTLSKGESGTTPADNLAVPSPGREDASGRDGDDGGGGSEEESGEDEGDSGSSGDDTSGEGSESRAIEEIEEDEAEDGGGSSGATDGDGDNGADSGADNGGGSDPDDSGSSGPDGGDGADGGSGDGGADDIELSPSVESSGALDD